MPLVELARHDDADRLVEHRKFQRRLAQQLAVGLDRDLGRGFDADAAAALLQDVADAVDAAVEQVAEAEEDVPEVDRADERQVQLAVIRHGAGQLLDAAAVELADADGDRQQQVVVDQPVVDPHLHARRLVAEVGLHQAPRIAPAALVALLLQVRELADNLRVEAHARDVGDVTALAVVRLLVGDHADVLQEGVALTDGPHGVAVAVRDAERAHPVVARADGHDGQQHLVGAHLLLDEQPVDHLVQRAVAADDDDAAVALPDGRDGEFRGVELVLGEDRFAGDVGIAQVLGYLREMVKPAAAAGHGIDDDKPFRSGRFHGVYLSGMLRSVCTRKS